MINLLERRISVLVLLSLQESGISTWDAFVFLLKEEYLSANYIEKTFGKIERRTQGPDESIGFT